ncbi:GntR family transcriptional regulator [Embleya sp. NPDC020886]|uniref:GntR family transcriptional regulator n=1 Tax=Embleya sp. NPDC020886 TaxID=3363980 RepID=UPI003788957E
MSIEHDEAPAPTPGTAEDVRRRILEQLRSGLLRPGDKLGGERDLAQQYGVSRSTLRHALDALQQSGVVRRVPGRGGGTFVSHGKAERNLSTAVGVPAYLRRQGFEAGTNVLSTAMRGADKDTARRLRLSSGDLVFDLVRLRLADGRPISLEHAQLVADYFPGLLERPLGGSVYELIAEHYGVTPADVTEEIEVVAATADEARVLEVEPGAPLISVVRVAADRHGGSFELSHDLFRADRTRMTIHTQLRDAQDEGGLRIQAT